MAINNLKPVAAKILSDLFDKVRLQLLGPQHVTKGFIFSIHDFDPKTTLGSLYTHSLSQHALSVNDIDKSSIERLNSIANGYLTSLQDRMNHEMNVSIDNQMHEANVKAKIAGIEVPAFFQTDDGEKIKDALSENVEKILNKTKIGLDRIVVNEAHNAQAIGTYDGIIGMASQIGISDPIIAKRGISDDKRCKHCWDLWSLEDKVTPRVYKLSEMKGGYLDRKNPQPVLGMTHPHCRCLPTTIAPGYGFDETGKSVYKGTFKDGTPWDEWEHQRTGKT